MIPISSAVTGGLSWSKTPHKCGYELKRNGELVAFLQRTNWWSSEYRTESQHGTWRFRRIGFWRAATEIVDANSGVQIATLKRTWRGGGTLVFTDGQTFELTSKGFWRPVWTVLAHDGQPVLRIHCSREKMVEFPTETPLPDDRLTVLVMFALYLMQQAAQDADAGAAVAAAIS